jgi:multicomponent Na+:H+ antiporter subunit F
MENYINLVMNFALLVMILLLPLAFYRVAKPQQKAADRLVGVDMISNLLLGIIVLLAIVSQSESAIDIGIAVAALSFVGTVGIARYISEGRVF